MRGQGWRRGTSCLLELLLGGVLAAALALVAPAAAAAAVSVDDVSVTETNASGAVATFTVTRTGGLLTGNTTLDFATADVSAHAPGDYTPVSGSLFFGSLALGGTQQQQVSVPIGGDTLDEPAETLLLVVSGGELGADTVAGTATITDDDPPPVVSVGNAAGAAEGASATFTIRLNTPSGRAVSVGYTTANGSAAAGPDYTAVSGTATISPGNVSTTVAVPTVDDAVDESDETFELRLSTPSNATLGTAAGTATILDDDDPPPPPAPPAPPPPPPAAGTTGATGATGAAGASATANVPTVSSITSSTSTGTKTTTSQFGLSSPRLKRPSTILVTVSCPRAASACSGTVTVFSRPNLRSKVKALRKERRLGRTTFRLKAGATRTVQMRLSKTDRVLLLRAGRMSVRAFAVSANSVRRTTGTLIARTSHS